MSGEGREPNETDGSGQDVSTDDDWPPFEQDQDDHGDWNLEERQEELERKERVLKSKEEELRQRERELDKRERQMENREQEVLDRREEIVDERERLEEKEEELTQRERELEEYASEMEGREQEMERLSGEIDEKLAGGGGSGPLFTRRPLRAGATLLGVLGILGLVGAFLVLLSGGYLTAVTNTINSFTGAGIPTDPPVFSQSLATGLAILLLIGSMVEFLGAVFAARGQFWLFTVAAGIVGMNLFFPVGLVFLVEGGFEFLLPGLLGIVLVLPIGLVATIFLAVGESQFT